MRLVKYGLILCELGKNRNKSRISSEIIPNTRWAKLRNEYHPETQY